MHSFSRLLPALLPALLLAAPAGARKERLELRYRGVELPGAPSAILAADVDGDGRSDLVVALAYTEWHQIAVEGPAELAVDEELGVDALVEVLTIVPSLFDRRELWVFLAAGDGGYRALEPLALDRSVLSLAAGPPGLEVAALTDDGLSALRLEGSGDAARAVLEPVLAEPPVLARTGNFVPGLVLGHDLDGDGRRDLLVPTWEGAAVYLAGDGGLGPRPASRLAWPEDEPGSGEGLARRYPLPEARDVTGDGRDDLLLRPGGWKGLRVLPNAGGGRFGDALAPFGGEDGGGEDGGDDDGGEDDGGEDGAEDDGADDEDGDPGRLVYFGDLDGDGVAEVVTEEEVFDPDAGLRKAIREAKRPTFRHRFYRTGPGLEMAGEPYLELETTGYAFEGDGEVGLPGGFQDLDGDNRQDLVALTLDFSLVQAVRILATHRISIGLDFHVWCQGPDGGFRAVSGLDLSGRFKLDLDDLRIGQLSQFAGDFDGDGRADFVQMGRGREVTIHRGREGCSYPPEPDLRLRLEEEPHDLNLVQVRDLDGDGFTDLLVIQPQKVTEPGVTRPVRLDLYLSGGGG